MGTLAYRRTGPVTDTPLLLLHAMPLDGSMWDAMRACMPDVDILSVDAPGFGGSPTGAKLEQDFPPPDPSAEEPALMEVYVDALVATLEALGITQVVVAGVSMGGAAAAALTDRHPEMVRGLAIIDSNIGADTPETRAKRRRTIELCDAVRAYDTVKDWTTTMVSPAASQEMRAKLDALFREVPSAGLAWLQRAQLTRKDRRGAVEKVEGPVLLMRGDDDPTCSREMLEELRLRARDARIVEVVHAGHFAPYEQPEVCAQLLGDFWRKTTTA